MAVIHNQRHPHRCKVYRMIGENEFGDGEPMVLYEGACRKYTTRSSRTSTVTTSSQYTLSIPAIIPVLAGDYVEVDDSIGHFEGVATEVNCNNIGAESNTYGGGTDIYWNTYKH